MFKILVYPNKKYEINVKNCLVVSNNLRYRHFFQYDKQINNFLQMEEDFANSQIDDQEDDQEIHEVEL